MIDATRICHRLIRIVAVALLAVTAAGCSDSNDSNRIVQNVCEGGYLLGVWFYENDAVRTTVEYRDNGDYSRLVNSSSLSPGFITTGTYALGNALVNSEGLEVCELTIDFASPSVPSPQCLIHSHVADSVLYLSDCNLVLDFGTPYDYVREPLS